MRATFTLFVVFVGTLAAAGCAVGPEFTSHREREGQYEFPEGDRPYLYLAPGEKLTYRVSWTGIPVGRLVLENRGVEMVKGEEAYHLTFQTISNRFLSRLFRIDDTVHTWISREDGLPLQFEKIIKEGAHSRHHLVDFEHKKGQVTYYRRDHGDRSKTFPLPPDAQDVFSVLYWVRWQPLKLSRRLLFNVNADEKNWVVKVEVIDLGILQTDTMGESMAYVLEPSATHRGKALEKGTMRVWISADRHRIPLAFQVKTPIFGKAYAVLSEAVLPPLPEEEPRGDDLFSRGYLEQGWLDGLTQSDGEFIPR